MEVVPSVGVTESSYALLFVLTNPGQLHVYDDECLTGLTSGPSIKPVQCHVTIPVVEPYMTISKQFLVPGDGDVQRVLNETVLAVKNELASPKTLGSGKWHVSGGFQSQLSLYENIGVERIYIAGYQDGSVRILNATFPVFSLIFTLEFQVEDTEGTEVPGASEPISAMDFNSKTSSLVVEVNLHHDNGWQSTAVISILNSPVRALQYTFSGARIIVGHECGKVNHLMMWLGVHIMLHQKF